MRHLFRRSSRLGLKCTVLIVVVFLLFAGTYTVAWTRPIQRFLKTLVTPIVNVGTTLSVTWHHWRIDSVKNKTLWHENARLKRENFLLQVQIQDALAAHQTAEDLKGIWYLKRRIGEARHVLITRRLGGGRVLHHRMWIDRGLHAGVVKGQSLIDEKGIVGQVISVYEDASVVRLITDPQSAIPVKVVRTGEHAILQGAGRHGRLKLLARPDHFKVKVGDRVVTSGLGSRYRPNYPVGAVIRIERSSGQSFANVLLRPFSSLEQSDYFLLVFSEN